MGQSGNTDPQNLPVNDPGDMPGRPSFEASFLSTIEGARQAAAGYGESPQEESPTRLGPLLSNITEACKAFSQEATTERQLRLVIDTLENQLLPAYFEASSAADRLRKASISKSAHTTYQYLLAAALKLNLFESPEFVSGMLGNIQGQTDERRQTSATFLRKAWTTALGDYLASPEESNNGSGEHYSLTMRLLPNIREGKQRAVHAVEVLNDAGILYADTNEGFWYRYGLRASRTTPEFLPLLIKHIAKPDVHRMVVLGNIPQAKLRRRTGQDSAAVTTLYVYELLKQYAKDTSHRNVAFIADLLRKSAPKDRTALGDPIQFGLREMVEFSDTKLKEWTDAHSAGEPSVFIMPKPLLKNDDGTPKQTTVDASVVMRALSRILYFSRLDMPEQELEPRILQDELYAELVGILYYGPTDETNASSVQKREADRLQRQGAHIGVLALQAPMTSAEMNSYGLDLKNGASLSGIIAEVLRTRKRSQQ